MQAYQTQESWIIGGVVVALLILIVFLIRGKNSVAKTAKKLLPHEMHLGAVPTYRSSLKRLTNELARVRRYQRPLSVVVLRLESDQLLLDLKRDLAPSKGNGSVESYAQVMQTIQLVFSLVGSILKESLRESDIATYDVSNNQYVVMLPESNREQAGLTVTRLKKLLFKRTAGHLVAGVAEFPADGLIIEDLVKSAIADCCASSNGHQTSQDSALNSNFDLQQRKSDEESESN